MNENFFCVIFENQETKMRKAMFFSSQDEFSCRLIVEESKSSELIESSMTENLVNWIETKHPSLPDIPPWLCGGEWSKMLAGYYSLREIKSMCQVPLFCFLEKHYR